MSVDERGTNWEYEGKRRHGWRIKVCDGDVELESRKLIFGEVFSLSFGSEKTRSGRGRKERKGSRKKTKVKKEATSAFFCLSLPFV